MQRRRKPKSEPRNIFDKSSGGKPPKSPIKTRRESISEAPLRPKSTTPPPPVTPKSPRVPNTADEATQPQPKVPKAEPSVQDNTILKEQLLGVTKRPTRGLTESKEEDVETVDANPKSSKAQEIIKASKARANAKANVEKTTPKPSIPTKKPTRPYRRRKPDFQPAIREKRLDRSRHMEYKYEMRGLLQEIDVAEEHRSALLGSIWAKGERQNIEESKLFISEKEKEGILSEEQVSDLLAIVDDYTIRR